MKRKYKFIRNHIIDNMWHVPKLYLSCLAQQVRGLQNVVYKLRVGSCSLEVFENCATYVKREKNESSRTEILVNPLFRQIRDDDDDNELRTEAWMMCWYQGCKRMKFCHMINVLVDVCNR
ncbi:hypothetical protein L798_14591 [Zootermopsis nevadensis]|uniref:Uncharacterized protein n=1 Tax=Zootermopsis nevadensis TaxID=136037 RepID=A0A067RJ42_ZOONE|nr:hypothetical protein L798_14591 [Zootermopsis nevadensis]